MSCCKFTFNNIQLDIHSIKIDGKLWMMANSFSKILNTTTYKGISTKNKLSLSNEMYINEYGLMELINNSKMTDADNFRRWICDEVLYRLDKPFDKFQVWLDENKEYLYNYDNVTLNKSIYICTTPEWRERNIYKIGVTHNLVGCLQQMNTTNYEDFYYVYTHECDMCDQLEKFLYQRFNCKCINRKFFKLTDTDINLIKTLCQRF